MIMKPLKIFLLALLLPAFVMVGCKKDDKAPVAVTGVTLNKPTLSLAPGDSETLTATVAPETATNKAVTWTSSDNTVASVDSNGLVIALKDGSTTITVTTADGAKTADCAVTVSVAVTGVTLNKSTLLLTLGATETLTATVAPETATNKAVTWSTGDSTTATVSADGLVTAVKEGTVTITVTTADGSFTADCVVTISGVLISGVIWATANVDAPGTFAATPQALGMLYQWGTKVGWSSTDPIGSSSGDTAWKNYTTSVAEAWASDMNPCPTGWQVASKADFEALADESKVSNTWTTQGDMAGRQFADKETEKSIFLPAAGFRGTNGGIGYVGVVGYYWSVTPSSATDGYYMLLHPTVVEPSNTTNRNSGHSVRCVRSE
jgi:uncharacterized protein (TIGR02145 family)